MSPRRGLILTYHRVTNIDRDPLSMAVRPDRFMAHLKVLRDLAECVPLSRVGRGAHRTVAVTLDDGYADAAEIATPILERVGVPATLFVTSDVVGADGEFWWDRLEHLLLDAEPMTEALCLQIDG